MCSLAILVLVCVAVIKSKCSARYVHPGFWQDRNPTCNGLQNASYCEISNVTIMCDEDKNSKCTKFYYNGNEIEHPVSEIRVLVFKNTMMGTLPWDILYTLTALERIECMDCQLRKLYNNQFEEAHQLTEINFSNNEISEIEYNVIFYECPKMQKINLANNKLRLFKILKDSFPNLKELYLQGNQLHTLDLNNVKLNVLNVSHNAITEVRLEIGAINIDASYNQITEFTIEQDHAKIIELRLRQNKVRNLLFIRNMTNLQYLDISENQLKFIDVRHFEKMNNLQEIWFEGNNLIEINNMALLQNIAEQHSSLVTNLQSILEAMQTNNKLLEGKLDAIQLAMERSYQNITTASMVPE